VSKFEDRNCLISLPLCSYTSTSGRGRSTTEVYTVVWRISAVVSCTRSNTALWLA